MVAAGYAAVVIMGTYLCNKGIWLESVGQEEWTIQITRSWASLALYVFVATVGRAGGRNKNQGAAANIVLCDLSLDLSLTMRRRQRVAFSFPRAESYEKASMTGWQ